MWGCKPHTPGSFSGLAHDRAVSGLLLRYELLPLKQTFANPFTSKSKQFSRKSFTVIAVLPNAMNGICTQMRQSIHDFDMSCIFAYRLCLVITPMIIRLLLHSFSLFFLRRSDWEMMCAPVSLFYIYVTSSFLHT